MAYKRLGDLLLSAGIISDSDITQVLSRQKETHERFGKVLVDLKIISEQQLIEALETQLGVEFIDLTKTPPPMDLAGLLPKSVAKKHGIVPVKIERDELYLAMSDPLNFVAVEEVKRITRKNVIQMIATEDAVEHAIQVLYGTEGAKQAIMEMEQSGSGDLADELFSTVVDDSSSSAPTIRLVNSIIERAVMDRASDIHLETRDEGMFVRIRVDGALRNVLTVPRALQSSVISRLKVMSGMDTSERKIPQNGRANVIVRDKDIDLRFSTLPTIYGEKIVIRLLDKANRILTREGIGLDEMNSKRYDRLMRSTSGVILISGPTGSGKSSTMSTMVRELNREDVNLITLEDPVEFNIDGVNQCQINEKTGMTFASGLRSILRQDPDIIAVGEIRDGETAEIAMRAAITGHLVLSTIHTSDAPATVERLVDIGVEPYLIASALKGVVAQRLVRKICPQCSRSYEPSDDELELLGMERTEGMLFYRSSGCPHCGGTGYKGRTGVFEVMLVDGEVRSLITKRADRAAIIKAIKADGYRSLSDRCRDLVRNGVTSVEEAARTIYSVME